MRRRPPAASPHSRSMRPAPASQSVGRAPTPVDRASRRTASTSRPTAAHTRRSKRTRRKPPPRLPAQAATRTASTASPPTRLATFNLRRQRPRLRRRSTPCHPPAASPRCRSSSPAPASRSVGRAPTPAGRASLSYSVYVSTNGGAYTAFQTNTTQTSATFTGASGNTIQLLQHRHRQGRKCRSPP